MYYFLVMNYRFMVVDFVMWQWIKLYFVKEIGVDDIVRGLRIDFLF